MHVNLKKLDAVAMRAAAVMAVSGLVVVTATARFWTDARLLALAVLFGFVTTVAVCRIVAQAGYVFELVGKESGGP